MSSRRDILDQRVALIAIELADIIDLEHELSHRARHALLAVCGDVAAALEIPELVGGRDQASGPEEGGP